MNFLSLLRMFFHDIGGRLGLLFLLAAVAALAEGIGFSMALPLLQMGGASGDNRLSQAITQMFQWLGLEQNLVNLLLFLVLFLSLRAVLMVWQTAWSARLLADYLAQLRMNMVEGLFRAHYRYILSHDAGFFTNAITRELDGVIFGLNMFVAVGVAAVTAVVYIALPLLYNPEATLFLGIMAVPIALAMKRVNRLTRHYGMQNTEYAGRLQMSLIETVRYYKYFRTTETVQPMLGKLRHEVDTLSFVYARMNFLSGIASYAFEPLAIVALACLVLFMVEWHGQTIPDIIFLLFLFRNAAVALLGVQPAWRKFLGTHGHLNLYRTVRQELAAQREADSSHGVQPDWQGDLELRNVGFAYAPVQQREAFALHDISMTLRPHQVHAIVGPSGAGKSTLIDLLSGLVVPDTGEITLAGTPYTALDRSALRRGIGFVPQQPVVWSDSVRQNILFWADPDRPVDDRLYRDMLEQAGLGHVEADDGEQLSGGERQRVALVRELLRPTRLLILDEATSALDSQTEQRIANLVEQERQRRTIVIIAHRLATIRQSDQIHVMDHGRLVDSGTFIELYDRCSLFRKLVDLQRLEMA